MNTFKADAATMNALFDAMAALLMSLTPTMTPEQRAAFSDNLARLAKNAEARNMPILETMLIDLHRASRY